MHNHFTIYTQVNAKELAATSNFLLSMHMSGHLLCQLAETQLSAPA
jgi:hypothetical protein